MAIRDIDMTTYLRRDHFAHFREMTHPFAGTTVQVDITDWMQKVRERELPFFLSFVYVAGEAANAVPELRQRIHGDGIIEYDCCTSSYIVTHADGTYRYCDVRTDLPFDEYLKQAQEKQRQAEAAERLVEEDDPNRCFHISCVPWFSYTALELPKASPDYSHPSITWGKYYTEKQLRLEQGEVVEKEKIFIPLTLIVNHALADGAHIAAFYQNLERAMREF